MTGVKGAIVNVFSDQSSACVLLSIASSYFKEAIYTIDRVMQLVAAQCSPEIQAFFLEVEEKTRQGHGLDSIEV